jgi:hypothetical protein
LALAQSNQTQATLHLLLEVDLAEIHVDQTSAEKPKRKTNTSNLQLQHLFKTHINPLKPSGTYMYHMLQQS